VSWIPGCLDGATRGELDRNAWAIRRLDRIDRDHDAGTERGSGGGLIGLDCSDPPDGDYGDDDAAVGVYDGDGSGRHRAP